MSVMSGSRDLMTPLEGGICECNVRLPWPNDTTGLGLGVGEILSHCTPLVNPTSFSPSLLHPHPDSTYSQALLVPHSVTLLG